MAIDWAIVGVAYQEEEGGGAIARALAGEAAC